MKILIKGGVMKNYDPKTMAVQYISPVSLLIGVCDRDPGFVKEAVKILEDHIRQFNQVYSIKNKRYKNLLIYLPALFTWGTIMLATPIAFSMRYVYILVLIVPMDFVIPFLSKDNSEEKI